MFGWEFFVPEDADIGPEADLKLLRKVIGLTGIAEFIELRSWFYGWWKEWKATGRFALKVANAFSGGLAEVATHAVSATAETLLGSAEIASDSLLKDAAIEPRLKAAAMFHDARRRLGWKVPVQP